MAKQSKRIPGVKGAIGKKTVRAERFSAPRTPSWKFSSVDRSGPFHWPSDRETLGLIAENLHQFDSMTWEEIEGSQHHAIGIESLSSRAQKRLAEIRQDDVDEVFSFRLSGKRRVIGIREVNVVRLLWWDPEHQVCPSLKKHT